MKLARTINGADLFCGAGGTSEGMMRAAEELQIDLNLLAINHWPVAIHSHSLNHPTVHHKCESLDKIDPRRQVPGGRLRVLAASPECKDHSNAAGGRPRNDQNRATAWHVTRWCSDLVVDDIFLENVPEFQQWGPLLTRGMRWRGRYYAKDKPNPRRRGQTFKAFINTLETMGYRVEYNVQCAAAFGDPTSRRRLIILARRNGRPFRWPTPTHGPGLKPYRTAREIIDWDLKGKSIFNRKKPLSPNTLRRIEAGLKKFCGEHAQPFLIKLYGTNNTASVDDPLPTITAGGNHLGLVQPFIIHTNHHGGDRCHSLDQPIPTITGAHRGEMALVEPFVIGQQSGASPRSVDEPLPTICGAGAITLVQPFLTKYYHTGICKSVDEPIDTITGQDRFALVEPRETPAGEADILLRMLQPHELQLGMSFPRHYRFHGVKEDQVKQIGNAVPVELAKAHMLALLS